MIVHSIARRFITGSAPGNPRQTGHVCVFSPAPNPAGQRQNIFVRVFSWTWISSPMTGSQRHREPLRDGVERERLLERVPDAEEDVLAELRADELQPDRQSLREPARDREPGQPGEARRDRQQVARVHRKRVGRRSPTGNATVGEVGVTIASKRVERLAMLLG